MSVALVSLLDKLFRKIVPLGVLLGSYGNGRIQIGFTEQDSASCHVRCITIVIVPCRTVYIVL